MRVMREALGVVEKRRDEIIRASVERRKEIWEEIYNNIVESIEEPAYQEFIRKKKQDVLRSLERTII